MTESRQQTNEVVHFSGVTARLAYIPPAEEEIIFQDDNRFTNGRWAERIDMIKVGPPPSILISGDRKCWSISED